MSSPRPLSRAATALIAGAVAATVAIPALAAQGGEAPGGGGADAACRGFAAPQQFEMDYIDTSRAGGEPLVVTHPDGQLLWGSHAGTTHFYSPEAVSPASAAFIENYQGQTYQYVSEDGRDWTFIPRLPVPEEQTQSIGGIPASGFSDPEFAVDAAGNVFISEINLANIAVSKSVDGGRTYGLQNVIAFSMTDRQWMAADGEDELYMTGNGFAGGPFFPGVPAGTLGHFMAKSTDGGVTWNPASTTNPGGIGDIQIDREHGFLYELTEEGGTLSMARFPNIREEDTDFTVEHFTIAEGLGLTGVQRLIDPTFAMDAVGNLYAVWTDNGTAENPQGVYYAASGDQGETWTPPQRVDPDDNAIVWPWVAVGDPGHVSVVWLQGDRPVDAELPGEAGGEDVEWHVMSATTPHGLGCEPPGRSQREPRPVPFTVTQASSEPVHTGTICQHGTLCQTDLTDRRLGDYFSNTVDGDGRIHIAVSDTRQGGAVALPLHIRQTDGPLLVSSATAPGEGRGGGGAPAGAPEPVDPGPGALPATGGGVAAGLLLVGIAASVRRRRG